MPSQLHEADDEGRHEAHEQVADGLRIVGDSRDDLPDRRVIIQQVRKQGEQYCLNKKLNCTFIRPWYVLGPGHWWPIILYPFYGIAEVIPSWRQQARSKALVTIGQMIDTLINVTRTIAASYP